MPCSGRPVHVEFQYGRVVPLRFAMKSPWRWSAHSVPPSGAIVDHPDSLRFRTRDGITRLVQLLRLAHANDHRPDHALSGSSPGRADPVPQLRVVRAVTRSAIIAGSQPPASASVYLARSRPSRCSRGTCGCGLICWCRYGSPSAGAVLVVALCLAAHHGIRTAARRRKVVVER